MVAFGVSVWLSVFVVLVFSSWSHGHDSSSDRFRITFRHGRGKIPIYKGEGQTAKPNRTVDPISVHYGGYVGLRDETKIVKSGGITSGTILQKLDHFDGMNLRRWKQRYWVNDHFYKKDGPVFLHIASGAVGDDLYWIGDGDELPDWLKKAEKFGAICFFLEHRYYGESKPTSNLSVPSMKFLSTYQALADIANFIQNATAHYQLQGAPWVLFGCSYAGTLAAWSRLKYPHLVSMAVSSGAPLEAKLDFSEYAEVVTRILKAENEECVAGIKNATQTIEQWLGDSEKLAQFKKMFNLCEDLDPTDKKNVSVFFAHLAENVFNIVQESKINRGTAKENFTATTICKAMSNRNLGDYLSRYAAVQRMIVSYHGLPCSSISYKDLINYLKNEKYAPYEDWRQWSFQVCNEFGFYTTSNSPYQPFGHNFDLDYYMDQCSDIFGVTRRKELAQSNIEETLRQYGGRNPKITKVIFTYGTSDPWYPLGVTETHRSMKVIPIEGSSHCADFYAPDAITDSKSLKSARQQVDRLLERWIENHETDGADKLFSTSPYLFLCFVVPFVVKMILR